MNYYQDITLLPDAEVSLGFIWEKVYQQIHLMLVEHKNSDNLSDIGLSFPAYGDKSLPLGNQLRLFAASEEQLARLAVNQWLQRLTDYVHIKPVKPVPDHVTDYACFTRWNPKSQQRRLKQLDRRTAHLAQKHGVAESEMRAQLLTSIENHVEDSKLPFIHVQSLSTPADSHQRHRFLLFIQCDKHLTKTRHTNTFTCYGLSQRGKEQQTLVPWF